jgi:hypothetical protein
MVIKFLKRTVFIIAFFSIITFAPGKVLAVTLTPTQTPTPTTTSFQVTITTDKAEVKAGDSFSVKLTITNNGTAAINNMELRVPFYDKNSDATLINVNPSFNKLLNSNEYPAGFNSRSWLINTFDPGETQTYTIDYKVIAEPKNLGNIFAIFTLPTTWTDPGGLQSNTETKLATFRADAYINSVYKSSFSNSLPKLISTDTPLSKINLNANYYFSGSRSTSLKSIVPTNINAFPGFILETSDVLLEWQVPIDFSGSDVASKMAKLDDYLKLEFGKVTFSEKDLPFLAKATKITFKNLDLISEPKIKIKDNIAGLKDVGGTINKASHLVVITLTPFGSVSVYPNLTVENSTIESADPKIKIKGTISDASAKLTYTVNDQNERDIIGLDIQTGAFEFEVNNDSDLRNIEVAASSRNSEKAEKVILVKSSVQPTSTDTPITVANREPKKQSALVNPLTVVLAISGLAVMSVLGGFIYYIYYKSKKGTSGDISKDFTAFKKEAEEKEIQKLSFDKAPEPTEIKKDDVLLRRDALSLSDLKDEGKKSDIKPEIQPEVEDDSFLRED